MNKWSLSNEGKRRQMLLTIWFVLFNLFAVVHAVTDYTQNRQIEDMYMMAEDLRDARERLEVAEIVIFDMHRPLTPNEADISYAKYMAAQGLVDSTD